MEDKAPTLAAGQTSGVVKVYAERLQGYPDNYTACGADGKPISDSKRYMMLGNSIATPCVAYIMQGICDAVNKE